MLTVFKLAKKPTCRALLAGMAGLILGGCAFQHTSLSPDSAGIRMYPDRKATPLAAIHVETWEPRLFYGIKLGNASLEKSERVLVERAKAMGADVVISPKNHVETHCPSPFPFIIGWKEYHVWGVAVKHEN